MTDAQVMTLALAVIVPLSMLIYSNSRVTEARETLRAELSTGLSRIASEIQLLRSELRADVQSLRAELRVHELEHHR
jgi:hypothetical protein